MDRRNFFGTAAAGASLFAMPGMLMAREPGESEDEFNARMAWWREARFGMFIHWGIYAELGLGEWAMNNLKIPERAYQKLARRFNPAQYDPREWVRLAKAAGMKYIVITSKHHDGFCMFDSKLTDYDIVDATPYKRDVMAPLARACAEEGLRFGFYYSILDAHQSGLSSFRKMKDEGFAGYESYLKGQIQELLTNYGPIGSLFFDGQWIPQWNAQKGEDLERCCRALQPQVIINDRVGKQFESGDYNTPEQFIPQDLPKRDWETCMTMAISWGYHALDRSWKSPATLIRNLIEIVSKGGNYLLNVGPTGKGIIPAPEVTRLTEIGEWMAVNNEAIYGTMPGPVQNAPWGKSAQKPGRVFLFVFEWPQGELVVEGLAAPINRAYLLADPGRSPLPMRSLEDKVIIKVPEKAPHPAATVIVIE